MATIKLDFTQKTFDKAKPQEVKGAKLSAALKKVEEALAQEKKSKDDAAAIEGCISAVQAVAAAAQEAIKKECDAKKHKDLVSALKKLDSDCKSELKRLDGAMGKAGDAEDGEDSECSDEELLGLKLFKECIKKAKLKNSTDDGISFCFGVHKKAEECKLVFMKKKKFATQTFKRLYKIAKAKPDMGLKRPKMTYGAAYRDKDERDTLVLHIVDGAPTEIPGMVRKLEKWRKRFKQDILPFKELSLRTPSGEALENTPDPDEEEEELLAGAEGATPEEQASATAAQAPEAAAAATASVAPEAAAATAAPAQAAPTPEDAAAFEDRRKEFRKARRAWQAVKEKAIQDLEAVKDGIRDYYLDDPEQFKVATSKMGQLDAIMDNLNDELRDVLDRYVSTPRTRQAELQRLSAEATGVVQRFLDYARSDKLLGAVDQKEFADVTVKAPIEKALRDLVGTLG